MIEDKLSVAIPVFRALGEPSRVRIVAALIEREGVASVGELQCSVDLPQSTVSRHLRVLLEAGLVSVSRDGAQRHYRLDVPLEILDVIEALVAEVRACQAPSIPFHSGPV